jgi:hypothetical protein
MPGALDEALDREEAQEEAAARTTDTTRNAKARITMKLLRIGAVQV